VEGGLKMLDEGEDGGVVISAGKVKEKQTM
jgi:hypothetical protein